MYTIIGGRPVCIWRFLEMFYPGAIFTIALIDFAVDKSFRRFCDLAEEGEFGLVAIADILIWHSVGGMFAHFSTAFNAARQMASGRATIHASIVSQSES